MDPSTHVRTGYRLRVRFVGSGSEYFRIWIVNLLLTVATIGLYYPWARVRRQRYFLGCTEIAGRPLAFHAEPRRMTRGYALVGVLALAYGAAQRSSPLAATVAALALAALWPALWHSSLRFRMANLSWCGLAAGFAGTLAGAYRATAPALVATLLLMAPALAEDMDLAAASATQLATGVATVAAIALLPLALWSMRRYQQGGLSFANEHAHVAVPPRAVYAVFLGALAMLVPAAMIVGGIAWALTRSAASPQSRLPVEVLVTLFLLSVAGLLVFQALLWPYVVARLQNLFWRGTFSANLRFKSRLKARRLMLLSLKNWLLTMCTFGLYAPFAAVATARLRLEAVTVVSAVGARELLGQPAGAREGAAGDAAGELLGVDIGL